MDKQEEFSFSYNISHIKWTTERMRSALAVKPKWMWKGFAVLAKTTKPFAGRDGIGFNRNDERRMMRIWKKYSNGNEIPINVIPHIRPYIVDLIHKVVLRYSRQLAQRANQTG